MSDEKKEPDAPKLLSAEETMRRLFEDHDDAKALAEIRAMTPAEFDRELEERGLLQPKRRRVVPVRTLWLVAAALSMVGGGVGAALVATNDTLFPDSNVGALPPEPVHEPDDAGADAHADAAPPPDR